MEKIKCIICEKTFENKKPKNQRCNDCKYKRESPSPIKGVHIQFNTGRTHFKKGMIPWNKGLKWTDEMKANHNQHLKGTHISKPDNFSETMRKVNPPIGRKVKFDWRDKDKALRVWRHGYIFVYKPEHPTSRKTPPDYGYIAEHRMIMELYLGRDLKSTEIIHHLDGKKSNNKIENLLLCETQREHNRVHTKMEIFVEKLIREDKVYYDRKSKEFRFR